MQRGAYSCSFLAWVLFLSSVRMRRNIAYFDKRSAVCTFDDSAIQSMIAEQHIEADVERL
jgi:hypothetical protein